MSGTIQSQVEKLHASMRGLEAQRSLLGDEVVEPALAALRQQLAALEEQAAVQAVPVEERRLVTILFMDMVGSTSLAEKLDPEEWRGLVAKLHAKLGEIITAHHGTVGQYLGDGLLAFFGAVEAREHDAENAIRAALEGHSAITGLFAAEKIQLRAGIHSGLVVVGELGTPEHSEFTASGDAMNMADRLQRAAPPGGTLISHETYRYVRGVFDVTPRPALSVKGKSEAVQTYLVRRAKPRPFRNVARGVAGVETRTVGREREIQALQEAYLRAYEQHGVVWAQMVSDLGVGKSRLLEDLNDWMELREETYRLLRARAFPDDAHQPFAMVRRMWFDRFQIAEDAPLEQAETKWVERFREFTGLEEYEEPAHALGLLVGLPFNGSPYIGAMRNDPTQVKGRALVVSRELVKAVRKQYPLVVLLEDLQSTDAASWEYLVDVFLGDIQKGLPNGLFILGAARPEWQPPELLATLLHSSHPSPAKDEIQGVEIYLPPLSDGATRELALELLQKAVDVPEEIIDLLVERSEGVPYYTEEMVNWFIDRGVLDTHGERWRFVAERLKEEPLPATLQHLLLTRLSSLSQPERAALQRGAIFGRRFWSGGVEALGATGGEETLRHLKPRGFVEEQPESAFRDDTEWSFHHNLLQEVTYESVLKRERAGLHKVAAQWMESQARQARRLDEFAGLLGEHYERAGELSTAADWYLRAGKRASAQGAPRQAAAYFTRSLELLPPVDRQRRWEALAGREQVQAVMAEAEPWKADIIALLELARSFNDDNYLAEAYHRQAMFGRITGDIKIFRQAAGDAYAAAQRCGNEPLEIKAMALVAFGGLLEDKTTAMKNIEEALSRARRLGDESVVSFVLFRAAVFYSEIPDFTRHLVLQTEQIGLDHRLGNRIWEVVGLGNLGSSYMGLGLYKQARAAIEQARQIAEAMGARHALAFDLLNLSEIYRSTGDLRKARSLSEEALEEISGSKDARGQCFGLENLGLVLFASGDTPGAARRFGEGREIALSQNMATFICEFNALLAACAELEGHLEEARQYITEAWDFLKKHGWTGISYPGMLFRICAEIFDVLGEEESSRAAIEIGHQALMEMANKISEPAWRQSFLENVPDNREFLELWERNHRHFG